MISGIVPRPIALVSTISEDGTENRQKGAAGFRRVARNEETAGTVRLEDKRVVKRGQGERRLPNTARSENSDGLAGIVAVRD